MRRSNLPTALSTLIRREQESRELHEPLGKTRLLTLTGASGVAKTRPAIELDARRIDCYRDGVRLSTCPGSAAHRHYRVGLVWRARGRSGRGEPHREWSHAACTIVGSGLLPLPAATRLRRGWCRRH